MSMEMKRRATKEDRQRGNQGPQPRDIRSEDWGDHRHYSPDQIAEVLRRDQERRYYEQFERRR